MASCQRARGTGRADRWRSRSGSPGRSASPSPTRSPSSKSCPNRAYDALHAATRPQSLGAEDPDPSRRAPGGVGIGFLVAGWAVDEQRPPPGRHSVANARARALASAAGPIVVPGRELAGPEAEASGSVARRAHAPEDYAARRISMPTLSLAFRVLVRCPERGLPAPDRSSPYRKPHLTLPRQGRTRDPFTAQSNLFRPQQKHPGSALSATPDARPHPRAVSGAGCFWWRRRVPPPGPETLL